MRMNKIPQIYQCKKCNKILSTRQRLESHIGKNKCNIEIVCDKCNKKFMIHSKLSIHQKRKKSCEVVDEVGEDIDKQCEYCSKILYDKSSKTKHETVCKDKKEEDKSKLILKKLTEFNEKLLKAMERQEGVINLLNEKIEKLQPSNNTTNNDNRTIIINNYNTPNYEHLLKCVDGKNEFIDIFNEKLVQTPMELVSNIWFNPEHPENLSIYLVNKSTKEVHVIVDNKWVTDTCSSIADKVRILAYDITIEIMDSESIKERLARIDIVNRIKNNQTDKISDEWEIKYINKLFLDNRALVEPIVKKQKDPTQRKSQDLDHSI